MLHWIPSHIGISGNNKADIAAKEATGLPLHVCDANNVTSRNKIRANINKLAMDEWDASDATDKIINPISQSRDWNELIRNTLPMVGDKLPKQIQHVATRLRIGHRRWADVINRPPNCTKYDDCYCGEETFSIPHILTSCPEVNYEHILKLKVKANNRLRNKTEQAIEIMRLGAMYNYGPLAAFYFENENMFW